ncbi:MAG: GIY-YIG nuclease family protein [Ignavibacteriales bacterium]|nr:GIY-YIG nuclease family protein [Ignavibacteriales bacterium]
MSNTTLPFAYQSFPADERGLIRARTDSQLRLLDIPREIIKDVIEEHFGKLTFSGIYLLLHHDKKKVYVGQASNLKERIVNQHDKDDSSLKNWQQVVLLFDGRPSMFSDLSDESVRLELERYTNSLFIEYGNYKTSTKSTRQPEISFTQSHFAEKYKKELAFVLFNFGLIKQLPIVLENFEDVLRFDELLKKLKTKFRNIEASKKTINNVDGKIVELRPTLFRSDKGSKKKQGWQVTIRGSFKRLVEGKDDGYFIYARGSGLIFSFKELKELIGDRTKFDTTDMYFKFTPDGIITLYIAGKEESVDVTKYKLPNVTEI